MAGLPDRAAVKLPAVDAKIAALTTTRTAPATVVEAGCDDLTVCAAGTCCPVLFAGFAEENRHAGPGC